MTPAPADTLREALHFLTAEDESDHELRERAMLLLDSHVLVPRETVERVWAWLDDHERQWSRKPPGETAVGQLAAELRACLGGEAP